MSVLFWVAAAWLAAAGLVTFAFYGARRSHRIYSWLFGEKPVADVRRLVVPTAHAPERVTRLAA